MTTATIALKEGAWDYQRQPEGDRPSPLPTVGGETPALPTDDQWFEHLMRLRDWSERPDSIPLEEGDAPVFQEVATRAFAVAKALYRSGRVAPTLVAPSCDGSMVFERHVGDMTNGSTGWEHWTLRFKPDGTQEFVLVRSTHEGRA